MKLTRPHGFILNRRGHQALRKISKRKGYKAAYAFVISTPEYREFVPYLKDDLKLRGLGTRDFYNGSIYTFSKMISLVAPYFLLREELQHYLLSMGYRWKYIRELFIEAEKRGFIKVVKGRTTSKDQVFLANYSVENPYLWVSQKGPSFDLASCLIQQRVTTVVDLVNLSELDFDFVENALVTWSGRGLVKVEQGGIVELC